MNWETSDGPDAERTQSSKADNGFRPGEILGDRYRLEAALGRGGMGEVWRAFDLKLRVEVALKMLLPLIRQDPQRLEMLRREVRSARDVVSPNVCRVFDLVEIDGQELISMEFVDGETLRDLLVRRSPLALVEARDLASQMLTGLQAIHDVGLVHRDLKPGNLMLTRTGRLVVLDFGLAKSVQETQSVAVAGTPAYMAPEQLRGGSIGPRSDLYAAGIILAEMVHPRGVRSMDTLQELWEALRQDPPHLSDGPWGDAILRALTVDPQRRHASALDLSRALGDGRSLSGLDEETNPYPGLASYTQEQARFFFGRELDVERLWRKLQQLSMLAVIGPSGVGKSSFLYAGVFAARPEGWSIVHCTPGDAPFASLAQALVPEFTGHTEAMQELIRLDDSDRSMHLLHRWRDAHDQVLLVVDQFEELFTLNPPETQERFANFLSRLALEVDAHVLVSMRDDFFFLCHQYAALHPFFSEPSPLAPLQAADLRRALVQPARLCGYEFESPALVEEMISEVEDERGALPLIAFAAASLWERRDRENGVIRRSAYEDIGRVEGALARHAEATLERIGLEREDLVREIFRNLVTAQNTRVVREREELLSVFEDRSAAAEVLDALVDARLLTSFEVQGDDGVEHHRVEVVHESLLRSWPRLVRWQTQDADGAQLRDQLRQAAQLWEQRSRSEDLLWSGTAYQEFELWRKRYRGGISDSEEAFAEAMETRHRKRRRRRRLAVAGAFVSLLVVLSAITALVQRSSLHKGISEALDLAILAEEAMEEDNTQALVLALASLERADLSDTREIALQALWKTPIRSVLIAPDSLASWVSAVMSPDDEWLAMVDRDGVLLWPRDGGAPHRLEGPPSTVELYARDLDFHPNGRYLACRLGPRVYPESRNVNQGPVTVAIWSLPDGELVDNWTTSIEGRWNPFLRDDPPRVHLFGGRNILEDPCVEYQLFELGIPEPIQQTLPPCDEQFLVLPSTASSELIYRKGTGFYRVERGSGGDFDWQPIGSHDAKLVQWTDSRNGAFLGAGDAAGWIRIWDLTTTASSAPLYERRFPDTTPGVRALDPAHHRIACELARGQMSILDVSDPFAQPTHLPISAYWWGVPSFTQDGEWIVYPWVDDRFGGSKHVFFHSLKIPRPKVYRFLPEDTDLHWFKFTPDGQRILARHMDRGDLWLCPVAVDAPAPQQLWENPHGKVEGFEIDESGRFALVNGFNYLHAFKIPLDGGAIADLDTLEGCLYGIALEPDGTRTATSGTFVARSMPDEARIRVMDHATGELQILEGDGESGFGILHFLENDTLLACNKDGLYLWDLKTEEYEKLSDRYYHITGHLSRDRQHLLVWSQDGLVLWDLASRTEHLLPVSMDGNSSLAVASDGSYVVLGLDDGDVLVHTVETGETHMLYGHKKSVDGVWISPDGEEIRSASTDGTVRVWKRPRGRPIHDLPIDEFLTLLKAQTNLRAALDETEESGYRIEYEKFAGWETAPTW